MYRNLVIDRKEAVLLQNSILTHLNQLKENPHKNGFKVTEERIEELDKALEKICNLFSSSHKESSLRIEVHDISITLDTAILAFNHFCREFRECENDIIQLAGYTLKQEPVYRIKKGSNILAPQLLTAEELKIMLQVFCAALGNGNDALNYGRFKDCITLVEPIKSTNVSKLEQELKEIDTNRKLFSEIEEKYLKIDTDIVANEITLNFTKKEWRVNFLDGLRTLVFLSTGKLDDDPDSGKSRYRKLYDKVKDFLNEIDLYSDDDSAGLKFKAAEFNLLYNSMRMLRGYYYRLSENQNSYVYHLQVYAQLVSKIHFQETVAERKHKSENNFF